MDFCRNVSVAGEYLQPEQPLSPPCSANLDDLFSTHNTEVDVSLEWLSIFVEDCLSSSGNCLPAVATKLEAQPPISPTTTTIDPKPTNISKALHLLHKKPQIKSPKPSSQLHKFVVPGKARSKRKKRTLKPSFMSWTQHLIIPKNHHMSSTSSDPLLLQQAYWLADSELIVPKKEEAKEEESGGSSSNSQGGGGGGGGQGQARRCSHCQSQRTPQWRAGPLGPKTLCNACGVRYKSGRLLPEYRPAKSPTFVSYLHSNSHKKVMEMRTIMHSPFPTHHQL